MHKVKLCLTLMICSMMPVALFAQTDIVTIDGIYIERDTLNKKTNLPITLTFRLNERPIQDGDVIVFDIPGFGELMDEEQIPITDVKLLIESVEITEIPVYIENAETGTLRVDYTEEDLTTEHRQIIFNKPGKENKRLRLGISAGDKLVLNYSPKAEFYFVKIKKWSQLGYIMIVGCILFFAFILVYFPSILKDQIPSAFKTTFKKISRNEALSSLTNVEADQKVEAADSLTEGSKAVAYSFSKTQLVFWTIIIICSFIYIWALTDDFNPINTTALILLGISAATTAAGGLINKRQEEEATTLTIEEEEVTTGAVTETKTTFKKPSPSLSDFIKSRITNRNFLSDILSDNQGINLHRVQSFLFNLIFGVIFVKSVVFDYVMPTFGEVELLLLGISNGTYAFMKTTENK